MNCIRQHINPSANGSQRWLLLAVVVASIMMAACNKTDENGALDGNWQMVEWRDHQTNKIIATRYSRQIYYAVKLNLIQMMEIGQPYDTFHLAYFHQTADSLYIDQVFQRPFDTIVPKDSLYRYGGAPEGRYAIIQLTHDNMVLRNSLWQLSFRKY